MVNVRAVERDQQFLMPPSVSDWLPEDHLAWFVLDLVAELDLAGLYASLRADGRGGASYHPEMMLGVLLYAYCVGERSSRRIERRLTEDVAFRVVAANQCPDHATLARFRARHREAISGLFSQMLGLCVAEGLVETGVVAIDGTKVEANASAWSNRTRRQIADEILDEAEAVDAAEDEEFGDRRGGELPDKWTDRNDRRSRLREALRQLDAEGAADWESYMAERQAKEAELGRKLPGRKPRPGSEHRGKTRLANTTDPDSRMLRARNRFLQGYNAQAAVSEDHIVVAAELTNAANDSTQLVPMVDATRNNLTQVEGPQVGSFVADAGYWSAENLSRLTDVDLLVAPMPATTGITDSDDPRRRQREKVIERVDAGELTITQAAKEMGVSHTWARKLVNDRRRGVPDPAELRVEMEERLASEAGAVAYAKRKTTVEPVFGNLKANLGFRRFSQRGIDAVRSEWRLICTIHNLLKLHRHQLATT
ncbi:MAG TPA: IS1182 family transposase [Acidimicrobiia bacterium]